ncbi:MAG: S41 family peptidase [bacterium]|nr:S41 family peptidase [bacterium]
MSTKRRFFLSRPKLRVLLIAVLILAGVFYAGWQTAVWRNIQPLESTPSSSRLRPLVDQVKNKPAAISFAPFWEAWGLVDNYFIGNPDSNARVEGAISGMMLSLGDPYSVYLPKEENELFQSDLSGKFSGIGAEISAINGLPTIVAPLPGSPAEKAGAKAKDIIIQVDDLKTENEHFAKVINHIRGEKGTTVKLTVIRQGNEKPLEIPIVRDEIELPSVTAAVKTDGDLRYGYIQISQFLEDGEKRVKAALQDFTKQGVTKIVVDVRNDPGGLLNVAVGISSLFIDGSTHPELDRTVVWQKDRNENLTAYRLTTAPLAAKQKLVVLVNEGSASASEIFAGALRDYGRAELIGTKTFGKGSVQELHDLSAGGSVKVTIAKWLTPNKSEIDKQGIEPNIKVDSPQSETTKDLILEKALERLR